MGINFLTRISNTLPIIFHNSTDYEHPYVIDRNSSSEQIENLAEIDPFIMQHKFKLINMLRESMLISDDEIIALSF